MVFANGHNHSTFSDGVYTPEELACLAGKEGYKGIILTDHDTAQGTYFMQKAARKEGLLCIQGCEFSTVGFGDVNFHLLGFDFNPDVPQMREVLTYGAARQRQRTQLLFEAAKKKGNLKNITWEEVLEAYPYNEYICNNHVFRVLVAKGLIREEDYMTFFKRDFRLPFEQEEQITRVINKPFLPVTDVIQIILKAGGVPVLAHPHQQVQYVDELIRAGLMGLEVNHPDVTADESAVLHKIAEEKGLYKTGGTDHSGTLGGYEQFGARYHCEPERCGMSEEDFMKLYFRKLG